MFVLPVRLAVPAAALLAAACVQSPRTAAVELVQQPCPELGADIAAECGALRVYENRRERRGRIIPIRYVRVFVSPEGPTQDALIHLSGGPGEDATRRAAEAIAQTGDVGRDFIIVDQRGTGESNPLDCVKYDLEANPDDFAVMFERSFFDPDRFRACKDELTEHADLTQYTTSIVADDINDLREALGYETLTLAGSSYGTTLALEIMRRHGAHVRAAVLKGAVPPLVEQTETIARDLEDALDAIFASCAADPACNERFPTFKEDFQSLLETVRAMPVEVTLPHTLTREPTPVRLRYEELIVGIRYTLYSTQLSAGLPLAVDQAKAGDYARLAQLLPQVLFLLSEIASEGMWASVRCAEEFTTLDIVRTRALSENTMLGTQRLETGLEICSFWPRGEAAPDFDTPVVSDVPTLIVAGEVDAATPPWMAEEAARTLSAAQLVIIPNRSHWGLGGDACIDGLVAQFIADPRGGDLDAACVADYERPPYLLK